MLETSPPDKSSLSLMLTELGTSKPEDCPTPCDMNLRVGSSLFIAKVHYVVGELDDAVKLRIEFLYQT